MCGARGADSWAAFAQVQGWEVERGVPVGESRHAHLSPEAYKRLDDSTRAAFDAMTELNANLEEELAALKSKERSR